MCPFYATILVAYLFKGVTHIAEKERKKEKTHPSLSNNDHFDRFSRVVLYTNH